MRAKDPDNDSHKVELANTLGQLADADLMLGHLDDARNCYREEVDLRTSLSAHTMSGVRYRRELAGLYEKLVELNLRRGDLAEARRYNVLCENLRQATADATPGFWPTIHDLARSFISTGKILLIHDHKPREAREVFRKALDMLEKRSAADPANVEIKAQLAETLYCEATAALDLGDRAGADSNYRKCLEIRRPLATDPRFKPHEIDLIVALARCGEHAEAARRSEALVADHPDDENIQFQAACGFALSAGVVASDPSLARQYTGKALDCLRKGKARGWADIVTLETDPDLAPIRHDPAFVALLAEFKRPAAKSP